MNAIKFAWVICFEGVLFLYATCRIDILNHMMVQQIRAMLVVILFASGVIEVGFSVINHKVLAGWIYRLTGGAINILLSCLLYGIRINDFALLGRLAGFGLLAKVLLNTVQCHDLCCLGVKKLEFLVLLSGMVLFISFMLIEYEGLKPTLISGLILTAFGCLTFYKAIVCCKLRRLRSGVI
jgi:hypothetical protein